MKSLPHSSTLPVGELFASQGFLPPYATELSEIPHGFSPSSPYKEPLPLFFYKGGNMVKIHYRIYRMHCGECDLTMEPCNTMDDTRWRCLGCGKHIDVEVRTIRRKDETSSLEAQRRGA